MCNVKINVHFKYNFVALRRPFWDYSYFIRSKKQVSNTEPQITSSEEKEKKKNFFSPAKEFVDLLLWIFTPLRRVCLLEQYPPEVEMSENEQSKDYIHENQSTMFKEWFHIAEALPFSMGQKEAQLPHNPRRDEKGFGPTVGYRCRLCVTKGMCNGCENLTFTTFLFP